LEKNLRWTDVTPSQASLQPIQRRLGPGFASELDGSMPQAVARQSAAAVAGEAPAAAAAVSAK
jgi:hypothetical protein